MAFEPKLLSRPAARRRRARGFRKASAQTSGAFSSPLPMRRRRLSQRRSCRRRCRCRRERRGAPRCAVRSMGTRRLARRIRSAPSPREAVHQWRRARARRAAAWSPGSASCGRPLRRNARRRRATHGPLRERHQRGVTRRRAAEAERTPCTVKRGAHANECQSRTLETLLKTSHSSFQLHAKAKMENSYKSIVIVVD